MKKYLLLIAICISIIAPYKLYAFDLTVGASTWYTWWDIKQERRTLFSVYKNTDMEPTFLVGPVLSLKFNDDFNLSFIFLTTVSKFDCERSGEQMGYYGLSFVTNKGKADRTDADLTLNYRLNDYFKVFAGAKYLSTSYTITIGGEEFSSYGPGIGLGFTLPILDNLFLLANLSGFYLWGHEKRPEDALSVSLLGIASGGDNTRINDYGINSTLSLAYYIAPASTTVSLGGRYQYIKTNYDTKGNVEPRKCTFYGVTLSATYTFSF